MELGFKEWFIIQLAAYAVLWTLDDFAGSLLSITFALISIGILVVSKIADWIEPSRISPNYYGLIYASILAPAIITLIFLFLFNGQLGWIET